MANETQVDIVDLLNKILNSVYGKDVRQSIHDAIRKCYYDGRAGGTIDLKTREKLDALQQKVDTEMLTTAGGFIMDDFIDMDGNRIINVGSPENDSDAANKEYVDSKSTTFKLLWARSVEDQSKPFEAGTICEIPGIGTQYNDFCIRCRYSKDYGYEQTVLILGISGTCVFEYCKTASDYEINKACRFFEIGTNRIVAGSGFLDGEQNDSYCTPIAIYGINWQQNPDA